MKSIHWIIFAIAFWIVLGTFIADEFISTFTQIAPNTPEMASAMVSFLKSNNLISGLILGVLSLISLSTDAVTPKSQMARSLHWVAVGIALWIVIAPFALDFSIETFAWNNLILGIMVGIFSLVELNVDQH